ncbi:MAG: DUF4070 domain-containing protein [Desulfobacteraceae bacterium]|nr:MAG: DUF4070 domain-containing protein [Desulfobacteraceae bacterium]
MKVLLISPEFPDTFWGFKHAIKFIRKRAAYPPLGLLTVGSMLPREWEKRLADVNVKELREEDLAWADLAFIGAMAVQRDSVRRIVARCKKAGVKVVAGGPLFSSEYSLFEEIDHFVLNEAEITLPLFLEDLENGCARRVYRTDEHCDIKKTPVPMWELINFKDYASMSVQFSRGCPFQCEFCNVTALFGHKSRIKSAEQVIGELDLLYRLGWRGPVFFVDDNFIGNKKYLKIRLLPALLEWRKSRRGMPFLTEASIDLADDETLMEMMVSAGFDAVFIGIETPSEEGLTECNKKQNTKRDLIESVRRIQRNGLQVHGGFILGFDTDTRSIFQRQIDFIQNSGIVTAMVGLLQAPVGTKLYDRLKREGRLTGQMTGNTDGTTNIVTRMDFKALHEGYAYVMGSIYSPKQYYRRIRTFLRDYKPPKIKARPDLQRFLALFRSMLRLGIFGRERFQYWGILFWTLFRRPQMITLAVTCAIYGHHFRKSCKVHSF